MVVQILQPNTVRKNGCIGVKTRYRDVDVHRPDTMNEASHPPRDLTPCNDPMGVHKRHKLR